MDMRGEQRSGIEAPMARLMHAISTAVMLCAVLSCLCGEASDPTPALKIGEPAPVVLGLYSDGDASLVRPWEWADRHTLLVFWSPNDSASVEAFDELRSLHQHFGADALQIVSVATVPAQEELEGDGWNDWIDFIGRQPDVDGADGTTKPFPSAWPHLFEAETLDPNSFPPDGRGLTSAGRFGVTELPAAFLIGPDGRLAAAHIPIGRLQATVVSALDLAEAAAPPDPGRLQELFDLSARRRQLELQLEYIDRRIAELEKQQFSDFERVADPIGSDYWESISDTVLYAKATRNIAEDELLLYHAPGIYRVKGVRPTLTTDGECWYFRPDREIREGEEFTVIPMRVTEDVRASEPEGSAPLAVMGSDPDRPLKAEISVPGRPSPER